MPGHRSRCDQKNGGHKVGRGLAARFQPDVIADQGHLDFRTPIEVEPLQSASGRTDLPFSPSVTVITPVP